MSRTPATLEGTAVCGLLASATLKKTTVFESIACISMSTNLARVVANAWPESWTMIWSLDLKCRPIQWGGAFSLAVDEPFALLQVVH